MKRDKGQLFSSQEIRIVLFMALSGRDGEHNLNNTENNGNKKCTTTSSVVINWKSFSLSVL